MVDAKFLVHSNLGDIQIAISLVGGGAEANIDRWINQMESEAQKKPIRKQRIIGGIDSQMVDCSGTFSGHLLSSIPKRNCRLIGILIPRKQKHLAIKLVGPAGAVASYQEEFDSFLDSLTFEQ